MAPVPLAAAFLELPWPTGAPVMGTLRQLLEPEIAAYRWAHGKLLGAPAGDAAANEGQARFVEYLAASCPHCKNMQPVWEDATQRWKVQGGKDAERLTWQQKECFDTNWRPGKDSKECMEQHLDSFPTVRFFPPERAAAKEGVTFDGKRDAASLVSFAKEGMAGKFQAAPDYGQPDEEEQELPPILPGDEKDMVFQMEREGAIDMKLINYYSAGCPHSREMAPVFQQAEESWGKDADVATYSPPLRFETKECYDKNWMPGKDAEACKQQRIGHFPTVRLFASDVLSDNYMPQGDFRGPKQSNAIVDFVKTASGVDATKMVDAANAEAKPAAADSLEQHATQAAAEEEVHPEAEPTSAPPSVVEDNVARVAEAPDAFSMQFQARSVQAMMPFPVIASCLPGAMPALQSAAVRRQSTFAAASAFL